MRKSDNLLLESAYSSILLKSQLSNLTVRQLEIVIENASPYELDVIEELFGGVKSLFKAGQKGVQGAATAVKGAAQNAASSAKDAAQNAATVVKGAAQGAARAATAGAQQVGKNVKNLYQTGEAEAAAEKRKQEVAKSVDMMVKQLEALKQANPRIGQEIGDIADMTVGQIQSLVKRGLESKQRASRAASKTGFFGGVGTAAANAYKQA
jgi:hypothetical protein